MPATILDPVDLAIDPRIAAIDLEMVKSKLADPDEGMGWTADECDHAEVEYKRFLHLMLHHRGDVRIIPNKTMDAVWHAHILDTRAYHADTRAVFGEYLHHFPYMGLRGPTDRAAWLNAGVERDDCTKPSSGRPRPPSEPAAPMTIRAANGTDGDSTSSNPTP